MIDQEPNIEEQAEHLVAQLELAKAAITERLDALGRTLWTKKKRAVDYRAQCGIEQEWSRAEDAYLGIDDANRGTEEAPAMYKPSGVDGAFTTRDKRGAADGRSRVFMNITRPYVDAASARVGDMLLPVDDAPWDIEATAIPDMEQPLTGAADAAMQLIAQIKKQGEQATKLAKAQIDDWLTECSWAAEVRRALDDCARLGTGVLKGPIPNLRTNRRATQQNGVAKIDITKEIVPTSRCVSPWYVYPAPNCGEDIQNGDHVWEYDKVSAKVLLDMRGAPGVLNDQLESVIRLGPDHDPDVPTSKANAIAGENTSFDVWYYYGNVSAEDLATAGVEGVEDDPLASVPAMLTIVNGVVIRAALNPLDSGALPFDFMVWQRKRDMPWGTGVAVQISAPQRMLNGGTRSLNENAGLSSGPQIVMRRNIVTPADGKWTLTPRKFWWVNEGADVQDVKMAFLPFDIPSRQQDMMALIQFALKMAEDVTGMPMLLQGQSGTAPDTVGGLMLVSANASTVLRRIARTFDDVFVARHIARYFEWLQMYGDNQAAKTGDIKVVARGSTALLERELNNQAIMQLGQIVLNPVFGIDPEAWAGEMLRAQRLDPTKFMMSEEKKKAAAAPAPAPTVEAAKIRAEADLQKAQIAAQAVQHRIDKDTDRDTVYVNAEAQRTQVEHEARMAELQVKRDLAMLDYANKREMSLEQVKKDLAITAMKLRTQKELAAIPGGEPPAISPPTEPPQQAKPGRAFEQ